MSEPDATGSRGPASGGWEEERLGLFRQRLQCSITSSTPLLRRIADHCGLDMAQAMTTLRPSPDWPFSSPSVVRDAWPWLAGQLERRRMAGAEVVHVLSLADVATIAGLEGPLRLQITRRSVEVSCEIGGCLLRTLLGGLYIRLPRRLPDTVAAAAINRPLRDVLEHPLLDDPSWRLIRARPVGTGMWLVVETGQVPFRMPWSELCAGRRGGKRARRKRRRPRTDAGA